MCGICCTPEPPAAPKASPSTSRSHPMWFLTVTGPGFGPVHGATCGRGRAGRSASGGRTGRAGELCAARPGTGLRPDPHADDDPQLGEPICPDCYQYLAAVAFNWRSPELWRRFMIALRRRLAAGLGMSEAAFGRELRVSYAKVAEFQKRGIVHFHAIIRLDGAGDGYPPAPVTVTDEVFTAAVRQAVGDATVTATLGDSRGAARVRRADRHPPPAPRRSRTRPPTALSTTVRVR